MRYFLSRNIFRTLALLSLVSTLCLAAACEGIGDDEDVAAEPTAKPAVDDGEDSTTSAEAAREELPLPAEVQIREIAPQVEIRVER